MKLSIKRKISLIYISLIIIIGILGAASLWNMYRINQSVANLITTNYNSIKRITHMNQIISQQDKDVIQYLDAEGKRQIYSIAFESRIGDFLGYHEMEYQTIVIPEEMEIVANIQSYYHEYTNLFAELEQIEIGTKEGKEKAEEFYNKKMVPQMTVVKNELNRLLFSNEKALFARKSETSQVVQKSFYLLLFLFLLAGGIGYFATKIYTNVLFRPIYELTQNLKSVRQGNLNRKAKVQSQDELGALCYEFNNMTQRLTEFEQSTMGSLMEEKNRTFAIMRSIAEPMIILDDESKVTLMNRSFEDLFHTTLKEAAGKHFLESILQSGLLEEFSKIDYKQKVPCQKMIRLEQDDGIQYFNVTVTPMFDLPEEDKVSHIIVFYNVTELKLLEKMRSDFIATISHEFKTPLTSIVMGASLLNQEEFGKLTEEQKEIILTLNEDGERLCGLVNDLLELSKIESASKIYHFETCSVSELVDCSWKQFVAIAKGREILLDNETKDDWIQVKADFSKITWVLNNLISNALKYTKPGDKITIRVKKEENQAFFSVEDTGIGIDQEFLEKIFEKYVQVGEYDIEARGTGLGLAVSKEIISAHGGLIWCESEGGKGSKFLFTLPLAEKKKEV